MQFGVSFILHPIDTWHCSMCSRYMCIIYIYITFRIILYFIYIYICTYNPRSSHVKKAITADLNSAISDLSKARTAVQDTLDAGVKETPKLFELPNSIGISKSRKLTISETWISKSKTDKPGCGQAGERLCCQRNCD